MSNQPRPSEAAGQGAGVEPLVTPAAGLAIRTDCHIRPYHGAEASARGAATTTLVDGDEDLAVGSMTL
jgi:hypothetical protein